MTTLGGWMNKTLIGWGVDPKFANTFDETIIAILIIAVAVGLDYLFQAILVGGMKHYTNPFTPSLEYFADEAESGSSFDTYLTGNSDLLPVASYFCTRSRTVGVVAESLCRVYSGCFSLCAEWATARFSGFS